MGECRFNDDECYIHTKAGPPIGQQRGCPPALCTHAAAALGRPCDTCGGRFPNLYPEAECPRCYADMERELAESRAADLEQHVQGLYGQVRILTADQTTKANRIMDLERRVDEGEAAKLTVSALIEKLQDRESRLVQAEAREAAMRGALEKIMEGKGRYSMDPLEHCGNVEHQHSFDRYVPNPAGGEALLACACGVTRTAVFSVYPDNGVKTFSPEMNEKDQTIRALAAEMETLREALYDLWWWYNYAEAPYPDEQVGIVLGLLRGYDPRDIFAKKEQA